MLHLSPRQSFPGETLFEAKIERPELLSHIRRAMRRSWEILEPDSQWAPVQVSLTFRSSPFLSRFAAIFVLHQYHWVPLCTRQAIVVVEVIQVYARVARTSDTKARVVPNSLTGLELIFSGDLYHECFNVALVHCTLQLNARPVEHSETVHPRHGDFVQILVRHTDMHAAYGILASMSETRERAIRESQQDAAEDAQTGSSPSARRVASFWTNVPGMTFAGMIGILVWARRWRLWHSLIAIAMLSRIAYATSLRTIEQQEVNLDALDDVLEANGIFTIVDYRPEAKPISIFEALRSEEVLGGNPSGAPPLKQHQKEVLNQFEIPVAAEELLDFKYTWRGVPLRQELPVPSTECIPESIALLLDTPFAETSEIDELDCVHIYVDGSFFPETSAAAWSFTALGCFPDGTQKWLGDCLVFTWDEVEWVGATKPDAYEAELAALFFAGWWALALPGHVRKIFFFDNIAAGFFASGAWSTSSTGPLPIAVRAVHQLLSGGMQSNGAVQYQHVKSHKGDPMNEFADITAKSLAQMSLPPRCFSDIRRYLWDLSPLIGHFPMLWELYSENSVLPNVEKQTVFWHKKKLADFQTPPFVTARVPEGEQQNQLTQLHLTLAAYNVSTLDPSQGVSSSRSEYLRDQFAWHHVDVAALQETRCREQMFLEAPH